MASDQGVDGSVEAERSGIGRNAAFNEELVAELGLSFSVLVDVHTGTYISEECAVRVTGSHSAAVGIECSRKKRSISLAASGPRGSV